MKYPKEWIRAVTHPDNEKNYTEETALNILDTLRIVGALKAPPKPREWWICTKCHFHINEFYPGCPLCNCADISSGEPYGYVRVEEKL